MKNAYQVRENKGNQNRKKWLVMDGHTIVSEHETRKAARAAAKTPKAKAA